MQKMLQRIKSLQPEALGGKGAKSGMVSEFLGANPALAKNTAGARGPLRSAMMIRNPLLKEEYFRRQQVDDFVLRMNADVSHSLLDCPARYTVRVATFTGSSVIGRAAADGQIGSTGLVNVEELSGAMRSIGWVTATVRPKTGGDHALVEAVDKSHRLTEALRKQGWQAWEFHDRDSSIVCVGSIPQLAVQQADGTTTVNPEIRRIVGAFGPDPAKLCRELSSRGSSTASCSTSIRSRSMSRGCRTGGGSDMVLERPSGVSFASIEENRLSPANMPRAATSLVLGTTNAGKLREIVALLAPLGIECRSLAGLPAVQVEETGETFADNAALKAAAQARAIDAWVLAEDSGLVVPALGGAPGVRSARFSGPLPPGSTATIDDRNNALLLERLADRGGRDRAAHYACHAALADPAGTIVATSSGTCGGTIATAPRGGGGFGYDPLFIVTEYHRTFGEIPPAVKAVISHRGRALRTIIPAIVRALS